MSQSRFWRRLDLTAIVSLVIVAIAIFGTLLLLAHLGTLDADDAPAWVTAVFTGALVIAALATLLPAARQVNHAARLSAESHRPYVTLGLRTIKGGFVYLDLVNHGDRAALNVVADFDSPMSFKSSPSADPDDPFGWVSYFAPGERRSVMCSNGQIPKCWPPTLSIEITYADEGGNTYDATVVHNLDALKRVLTNSDNE